MPTAPQAPVTKVSTLLNGVKVITHESGQLVRRYDLSDWMEYCCRQLFLIVAYFDWLLCLFSLICYYYD